MQTQNNTTRKKELAAFYTHQGLTDIICSWAIANPNDTIFEPSFGGCGFLRSARDRLTALQSPDPVQQIFGCDIDPTAFGHLSTVFEQPIDIKRFYDGDFLKLGKPSSWPKKFNAVIGNPPYLPYQNIDTETRETVIPKLSAMGLQLNRRASLWAYFVGLSIEYVCVNGRTAWVLPSSFLYANYSKNLRGFLSKSFDRIQAFELKERQFLLEGTEEKTIVLLASGKKAVKTVSVSPKDDIPLVQCAGVKDLKIAIHKWETGRAIATAMCGTSVFDNLSLEQCKLVRRLSSMECCTSLGKSIRIKIGLVSGNNAFFLLDEKLRQEVGLTTKELQRVLPRFQFAQGLDFHSGDHDDLIKNGGKGYLVSCAEKETHSDEMLKYLLRYSQDEIEKCSTFKKRSEWSLIDDQNPPDAFFPVMHHLGPRLVLNDARLNCTNSVHRAYFLETYTKTRKRLISMSLLSTFSQISAEVQGRSYGSGALKHEPREAERIELLLPNLHHRKINAAYLRVNKLLRAGHHDEARQQVDALILSAAGDGSESTNISLLRSGLDQLRRHRHR